MNEFEWHNEKAASNLKKHGVSFGEAATVFDDPFAVYFEDYKKLYSEERLIVRGFSNTNRLLIVSFTIKAEKVRIISSRVATKNERKQHEE
ncbi:MAG: BrnT family toxin [Candidatus Kapabacteria bacterium]|nr:BrnT family toxin [Candidatus Kapabacteria bacterium]